MENSLVLMGHGYSHHPQDIVEIPLSDEVRRGGGSRAGHPAYIRSKYVLSGYVNVFLNELIQLRRGPFERQSDFYNHDFCGFDEGRCFIAAFQAHLARRVGGDDGSDVLAANGQADLRHQAVNLHLGDAAHELVAPGDASKSGPAFDGLFPLRCAIQISIDFFFGNPVMATSRADRSDFSVVDPLLQGGIADAENLRRLARRKQFSRIRHFEYSRFPQPELGIVGRHCKEPPMPLPNSRHASETNGQISL